MVNNINYLKYNKINTANSQNTNTNTTNSASSTGFSNVLSNAIDAAEKNQTASTTNLNDILERAAKKYNVPVNLLKAIAKAESNFNAKAVSCCGAQGIMQLMPSTAKGLGVENSFDPEQNIMGGAKYIGQLLKQYNGNTTLAVAAYNAGSGSVAKYGGVPPYAETQAYVSRVLDYAGENINVPNTSYTSSRNNSSYAGETSSLTPLSALYSSLNGSGSSSNSLSSSTSSNSYLNLLQLFLSQMQANSSGMSNFSSAGSNSSSNVSYLGLMQAMLSEMQANSLSSISDIPDTTGLNNTYGGDSYLNSLQSVLAQTGADSSTSSSSPLNSTSSYGLL